MGEDLAQEASRHREKEVKESLICLALAISTFFIYCFGFFVFVGFAVWIFVSCYLAFKVAEIIEKTIRRDDVE